MVIRFNFLKGKAAKAHIKATVRYNSHRRNRDGERVTRAIFGWDDAEDIDKRDVYERIDSAEKGTVFFRFKISPDRKWENPHHDLDLKAVTRQIMRELQARKANPVEFFGVVQSDHTDIPHIHAIVLLKGRIDRADIKPLRQAGEKEARMQNQARRCISERLSASQSLLLGRLPQPLPDRLLAQQGKIASGEADAPTASRPIAMTPLTPCPNCFAAMELWQDHCFSCGYEVGQGSGRRLERSL